MTQDDMVKVARECGIGLAYGRESIERFYTFVTAAEREACEEACEAVASKYAKQHHADAENIADECVAAIRARGET